MNARTSCLVGSFAIAALAALFAASARADAPLPVKVLTANETAQVMGFPEVPLAAAQFTSDAFVDLASLPDKSKREVEREAGATAAQYGGTRQHAYAVQPPPAPAVTAAPPGSSHFNFQQTGDAAQGWATTTASGMPFLDLSSFGEASASGTASWRARVPIPASGPNLYVQFRVPAAQVTGFTEENGPSNWRSRFRAELLIDGHPVWSSEASRFAELAVQPGPGDNCDGGTEKLKTLVTFGHGLGFSASSADQMSTARSVAMWLGAFPPGQTAEVSLIVRADTEVDHQCCPHDKDGNPAEFCTRSTALVTWDDTPNPVHFWVGPALAPSP